MKLSFLIKIFSIFWRMVNGWATVDLFEDFNFSHSRTSLHYFYDIYFWMMDRIAFLLGDSKYFNNLMINTNPTNCKLMIIIWLKTKPINICFYFPSIDTLNVYLSMMSKSYLWIFNRPFSPKKIIGEAGIRLKIFLNESWRS